MSNRWLNLILPIVCGLTAGNMYYIQPLIPEAAHVTGVGYSLIAMIYSIALVGDAIAIIFITPMGDFVNRKKIISILYVMLFLTMLLFYLISNVYLLLLLSFFIGVGASVIPIILAYVGTNKTTGLASIGKIMAGVLFGILLSRFIASFFAALWGWKSIYLFGAGCMLISLFLINYFLPPDGSRKKENIAYFKMALSSFSLLKSNASVRLYSASGFFIMAIFAAFWNNISIYLTHQFNFDQFSIGLFSLAGFLGALVAMFSNKILKAFNANNTLLFLLLSFIFLLMVFYSSYLAILVLLTLALDSLIQLLHVNNQVNMYGDCHGNESRAASCYMTSFILGGAVGAKLSTYVYLDYGWKGVSLFFVLLSIAGLLLSVRSRRS